MAYTKYSLTPANNTAAPPDGAPEGMLPSAVNDTMRDMMAQIRDCGDGVRDGTYTMTAPKITGGTITGVTLTGNTLTNPVITGATLTTSAFNGTVGATTASTGAFTTLTSNGATTFTAGTASTSTTTGTTVITGGLGVSGRINSANFDGIVGANTAAAGSFTTINASTSITNAGLTSGRVTFAGASGLLTDSAGLTFDGTIFQVKTGNTAATQFRIAHSTVANFYADYNEKGDLTVGRNSWSAGVTTEFSTTSATSTYTGDLAGGFSFKPRGNLAVTIAGNGSVGIGTSSPSRQLQSTINVATAYSSSDFDTASNQLYLTNTNTTTNSFTGIQMDVGVNSQAAISAVRVSDGAVAITFGTRVAGSRAERMRIDSSGNLLVGTTTGSGNRLDVVGGGIRVTASGALFNLLEIQDSVNQSGATYAQFLNSTGGNIGNITRVTTTNAVTYNTTSDYRLKTVTGSVTGQGERIDLLKPIDYQWKEGNQQARGFLAHEFQTVYPNSVSGDKDAVDADGKPVYQAMQAATSEVIADLVAEIQSLRQRITTLENK